MSYQTLTEWIKAEQTSLSPFHLKGNAGAVFEFMRIMTGTKADENVNVYGGDCLEPLDNPDEQFVPYHLDHYYIWGILAMGGN